MPVLWVFLGGGLGATLRWGLSSLAAAPWGTVGVNILGSFALALLMHPAMGIGGSARLFLCTGLMGGFTTYSTFNLDVLTAVERGDGLGALTTASTTLVSCLLAGSAGWNLGSWLGRQIGST